MKFAKWLGKLFAVAVLGLAIVIAGIAVLDWMFGDKPQSARAQPSAVFRAEPRVPAPTEPAAVAEEPKQAEPPRKNCVLGIPGETARVPVLPTEEGFDEYGKAAAQGTNDRGMMTVLISNGGFLVEKGTECVSISVGFASSRVRVLEGQHAGKSGWVPNEWRIGK